VPARVLVIVIGPRRHHLQALHVAHLSSGIAVTARHMETTGCLVYAAGVSDRSADWLAQAERDLDQALDSRRAARHEWACFAAQQAAEKAVKALHLRRGQEAWGHVVAKLLRELPEHITVPPVLVDKARVLDNFYIPSRYPNGHPEGAPAEHYGELQSSQAIDYASEILAFVRTEMARPADG